MSKGSSQRPTDKKRFDENFSRIFSKKSSKDDRQPEKDLTGLRFVRWTVLSFQGNVNRYPHWLCECECGAKKAVDGNSLIKGLSRSCGCLRREVSSAKAVTHGMSGTKTHNVWFSIKARVFNKKTKNYKNYGGRGIGLCERWMDFENFLEDMGEKPEGLSIERINNNGDYEPSNCRWATYDEQANNRRGNRMITYSGRSQTLAEWAKEYKINYFALHARLNKLSWSFERALTTPIGTKEKPKPLTDDEIVGDIPNLPELLKTQGY